MYSEYYCHAYAFLSKNFRDVLILATLFLKSEILLLFFLNCPFRVNRFMHYYYRVLKFVTLIIEIYILSVARCQCVCVSVYE